MMRKVANGAVLRAAIFAGTNLGRLWSWLGVLRMSCDYLLVVCCSKEDLRSSDVCSFCDNGSAN